MIKINKKNNLSVSLEGFTHLEKSIINILKIKVGKISKKLLNIRRNNLSVSLSGFTLIEVLISISIFAVVATIGASMFSTFANNQKRTKVSQELLNNAQYALEIISREVKNNEIIAFGDSQCKGLTYLDPISEPITYAQCLLFVRENGETAGFVYDDTKKALAYVQLDCTRTEEGIYLTCVIADGQAPATMLSKTYNKVEITNLQFILRPSNILTPSLGSNPNPYFDETGLNNQQPKVTILLAVKYPSLQLIEQVSHRLQTTVSSRVYKR
jgi:prepilin-type N-terminal cleavage/methylation domain-containing protein